MSIQTQIDRLNTAKSDIIAALTEKGVDTTGAGLSDIAGLIGEIQAGGEGLSVAYGTILTNEDTTEITVEHGLGITPDVVFYWQGREPNSGYSTFFAMSKQNDAIFKGSNSLSANIQNGTDVFRTSYNTLISSYSTVSSSSFYYPYGTPYAADKDVFRIGLSIQTFIFTAGTPFNWIALGGLT